MLGFLLCAKGFIFFLIGDKISSIDILAGIYIGLNVYSINYFVLNLFFVIYLLQKGVLSLFTR